MYKSTELAKSGQAHFRSAEQRFLFAVEADSSVFRKRAQWPCGMERLGCLALALGALLAAQGCGGGDGGGDGVAKAAAPVCACPACGACEDALDPAETTASPAAPSFDCLGLCFSSNLAPENTSLQGI